MKKKFRIPNCLIYYNKQQYFIIYDTIYNIKNWKILDTFTSAIYEWLRIIEWTSFINSQIGDLLEINYTIITRINRIINGWKYIKIITYRTHIECVLET